MKKNLIFALILLTGMSAFAGEAWNNHVGFGFRGPTGMTISEYNSDRDWSLRMPVQTGIDVTYTGVHMATGLSVRGFMDYNISLSDIKRINPKHDDNVLGFNIDGAIGIGFAPVRNDYLLLGFYGMAGVDFTVFPDAYIETSDKKKDSGSTKTIQNYAYEACFVGGNATAIWTPTGNRFSIYGSATVGYNLPGLFEASTKIKKYNSRDDSEKETYKDEFYTTGALKIIPSFGISWRF